MYKQTGWLNSLIVFTCNLCSKMHIVGVVLPFHCSHWMLFFDEIFITFIFFFKKNHINSIDHCFPRYQTLSIQANLHKKQHFRILAQAVTLLKKNMKRLQQGSIEFTSLAIELQLYKSQIDSIMCMCNRHLIAQK